MYECPHDRIVFAYHRQRMSLLFTFRVDGVKEVMCIAIQLIIIMHAHYENISANLVIQLDQVRLPQ